MTYKIHLENRTRKPGSHIIVESDPLFTVETREEAQEALDRLVRQGVRDVYAVGFDG
jgi:hypothetical protein